MLRCKLGYHSVRSHRRLNADGSKSYVEAYCRRNPDSKAKHLYASNLDYLFHVLKKNYSSKILKRINGYKIDQGQYDESIQFWLS